MPGEGVTDLVDDTLERAHRPASLGLSAGASGTTSCRMGDTIYPPGTGTTFATEQRE